MDKKDNMSQPNYYTPMMLYSIPMSACPMMQYGYICPKMEQNQMPQLNMWNQEPMFQYDTEAQEAIPTRELWNQDEMIETTDVDSNEIQQPQMPQNEDDIIQPMQGQMMGKALTFDAYYTRDDLDENDFRSSDDATFRGKKSKDNTCRILRKIEKNNPEIIRCMMLHGMPYPEAREILYKIIKLTLKGHD